MQLDNRKMKVNLQHIVSLLKQLCKVAQAWANKIAENDKMEHSENGYGT